MSDGKNNGKIEKYITIKASPVHHLMVEVINPEYVKHIEGNNKSLISANKFNDQKYSIDNLAGMLKRALEGNDKVMVKFDNEDDNINFILDVVNNFKKEYRIKTHKQLTSTIRTYPIMEQLIDEFATDFSNQQNKEISDKEIEIEALNQPRINAAMLYFEKGAKWYKQQLKNRS